MSRAAIADIRGGNDARESAEMMKDILNGERGAKRDMVLLNAGAALMAAGMAENIGGGINLAADCIDSGKAPATLESLIEFSNSVSS